MRWSAAAAATTTILQLNSSNTVKTDPFVHCTLEVDLVDGDVAMEVLSPRAVSQSVHSARRQTHQGTLLARHGALNGVRRIARYYGVRAAWVDRENIG